MVFCEATFKAVISELPCCTQVDKQSKLLIELILFLNIVELIHLFTNYKFKFNI